MLRTYIKAVNEHLLDNEEPALRTYIKPEIHISGTRFRSH